MISMISFANFDPLEKQAKFNDSPDAETDAENFAALLSAPLEQPPIFFQQAAANQANPVNSATVNQNPAIITTTEIVPSVAGQPNLVTKPEIFTAKQQFPIAQNDFPASEQQNFATNAPDLKTEKQNLLNGSRSLAVVQRALPLEQKSFSTEKTGAPLNNEEILIPGENVLTPNFQTEIVEKVSREKDESLINAAIATGEIEISADTEKAKNNDFAQINFTAEKIFPVNEEPSFANRLPKLLSRVADVFNEKALNPKVSGDKVLSDENSPVKHVPETSSNIAFGASAPEKIASIKAVAKFANGSANFAQTEIETPKAAKKSESHANFSFVSIENFLDGASPETKSVEATPVAVNVEQREIIEQIEPQLLHFLSLDSVEKEKKVMRMRLHPAELGTVEVRLEKDASGNLVADFQTENERTREILSESSAQLLDSLRDSGWHVERLEIVCSPFSSTNHSDRETGSRQPEPVANRNVKTASDEDSALNGETKPNQSNRLLSVRA